MNADEPITVIRYLRATPEQVWPYLTDGRLWARWQAPPAPSTPGRVADSR
jgi:uncharacterized protein YndB with AHSA1/START domain